MKILEEM
jgi:hypothetical protein